MPQNRGKYYRINNSIQSPRMLVIGPDGANFGVISKEEALKLAQEKAMDLIEIASQANPPVAKILDFQKFKYEESKKEKLAKKHAREVELKEIWLSPRIAEHDLQTRLRRAEEFLADGDKILFRVKFKGREMAHLEFGYMLIEEIKKRLAEKAVIERDPKQEGRSITVIIGKAKGSAKAEVQSNNNQDTNNS